MDKLMLGLKVKTLREHKKWTQSRLAEIEDISDNTLSNIERGIYYPRLETFNTLIISKDIYDDMKNYCNKSYPNETGGVLVGNYSSDQSTANVVKITPPPPNSRGTR